MTLLLRIVVSRHDNSLEFTLRVAPAGWHDAALVDAGQTLSVGRLPDVAQPSSIEGAAGDGTDILHRIKYSPLRCGAPRDCLAPIGHQLGGFPHRLVLGVDVAHEHHHSLVSRQGHADLDRDTRIGNVGR